jgi:hypothetical protein
MLNLVAINVPCSLLGGSGTLMLKPLPSPLPVSVMGPALNAATMRDGLGYDTSKPNEPVVVVVIGSRTLTAKPLNLPLLVSAVGFVFRRAVRQAQAKHEQAVQAQLAWHAVMCQSRALTLHV